MLSIMKDFDHLKLRIEDIILATNNFSEDKFIGRGGFGPVYKGELSLPTGRTMVAFKRLDRKFGQGNTEFWKEITMLSKCKHENLVSLLHFSIDGDERVLVYEYASRGSLDRYLNDATLTWDQRIDICIGVARALNYLHDPMKTHQRVLHRDIKSANILLDENWTAKVSDFGLSKIGPANQPQTYLVSNAVGTPGYCDPLYWEMGFLSKESDVYSFGVVLFEVMCGKLCCEYRKGELIGISVHKWRKCWNEKKLDEIIFHDLKEQIDSDSLVTFSTIAARCLERDRKERPTMDEIVKELEIASQQHWLSVNKNIKYYDFMSANEASTSNEESSSSVLGTIHDSSYENGDDEATRTLERPRLVWTPQLHKKFVDVVAQVGIKNAEPKTIMRHMNVDGLTRNNVASHLKKYRLYLKRMQGISSSSGGKAYPAMDH